MHIFESRVHVFLSYAHEDAHYKEELLHRLQPLEKSGLISWHDQKISPDPGGWKNQIDSAIDSADLVLLLVSPDFMNSEYVYSPEMQRALDRQKRGETQIIPLILKSVPLKGTPLHGLQSLPKNGKSILSFLDVDQAFENVARSIREAITRILPRKFEGLILDERNAYRFGTANEALSIIRKHAAAQLLEEKKISNTFDVFLCHNGDDKPVVKQIGECLKERGILPWLDEYELRPGFPWQRLLEQQIQQTNAVAAFVGKNGIGPWQHMEIEGALREFVNRGCPVIPVLLEDAPAKPELPFFLKGLTWVDFRLSEPDPWKQLIWGITGEQAYKW